MSVCHLFSAQILPFGTLLYQFSLPWCTNDRKTLPVLVSAAPCVRNSLGEAGQMDAAAAPSPGEGSAVPAGIPVLLPPARESGPGSAASAAPRPRREAEGQEQPLHSHGE